jgi:hypothetical protein
MRPRCELSWRSGFRASQKEHRLAAGLDDSQPLYLSGRSIIFFGVVPPEKVFSERLNAKSAVFRCGATKTQRKDELSIRPLFHR